MGVKQEEREERKRKAKEEEKERQIALSKQELKESGRGPGMNEGQKGPEQCECFLSPL